MSADERKQFAEGAAERRAAGFAKLKKTDSFRKVVAKIQVTPSCGCVFCDLGLSPDDDRVHRAEGHPDVECGLA